MIFAINFIRDCKDGKIFSKERAMIGLDDVDKVRKLIGIDIPSSFFDGFISAVNIETYTIELTEVEARNLKCFTKESIRLVQVNSDLNSYLKRRLFIRRYKVSDKYSIYDEIDSISIDNISIGNKVYNDINRVTFENIVDENRLLNTWVNDGCPSYWSVKS